MAVDFCRNKPKSKDVRSLTSCNASWWRAHAYVAQPFTPRNPDYARAHTEITSKKLCIVLEDEQHSNSKNVYLFRGLARLVNTNLATQSRRHLAVRDTHLPQHARFVFHSKPSLSLVLPYRSRYGFHPRQYTQSKLRTRSPGLPLRMAVLATQMPVDVLLFFAQRCTFSRRVQVQPLSLCTVPLRKCAHECDN